MDAARKIQFLYPPFFLIASLILGIYFDPNMSIKCILSSVNSYHWLIIIIGSILGGGIIVIVIGFFIATISECTLRLLMILVCKASSSNNYLSKICEHLNFTREINMGVYKASSKNYLSKICEHLNYTGEINKKQFLYAIATFDHEFIPKKIHHWIRRRWNAFNISVNSIVALLLALFIVIVSSSIQIKCGWVWWNIAVIIFLLLGSIFAWLDIKGMIEFQSLREHKNLNTSSIEKAV